MAFEEISFITDSEFLEKIMTLTQGKIIWEEHKYLQEYEGEFYLMFQGNGRLTYANGTVDEGTFNKSLLNGMGKRTYSDGTVEEGNFKNGILAVDSQTADADAHKNTDKKTNCGEFVGKGKVEWKGHQYFKEYEGEFQGLYRGKGKLTNTYGEIKEGFFRYGRLQGEGKITNKYVVQEGVFELGDLVSGEKRYSDGIIEAGSFWGGCLDGFGKVVYPDGTVERGLFRDGMCNHPEYEKIEKDKTDK